MYSNIELNEIRELIYNRKSIDKYKELKNIYYIIKYIVNYSIIDNKLLNEVIDIFKIVDKKGKLSLVDDKILTYYFYFNKNFNQFELDELKCLLLPEIMQENDELYLRKFGQFYLLKFQYNYLNNFSLLEKHNFLYSNKWNYNPLMSLSICAYFYANLDRYNYDYEKLLNILNNYFNNNSDYFDLYQLYSKEEKISYYVFVKNVNECLESNRKIKIGR